MKLTPCQDLPGISMYPKLWEHCGIAYCDLLDQLIALAMEKGSKPYNNFMSR